MFNVSHNTIKSLSGLEGRSNLKVLDLSHNQIERVKEVEAVKDSLYLSTLALVGNPVVEKEHYRLRVLVRLQTITLLDERAVSPQEKVDAINLYAVEGELLLVLIAGVI